MADYHRDRRKIDPTRADSAANTARRSRGINRSACFNTSAGPVAFSANCATSWASCRTASYPAMAANRAKRAAASLTSFSVSSGSSRRAPTMR